MLNRHRSLTTSTPQPLSAAGPNLEHQMLTALLNAGRRELEHLDLHSQPVLWSNTLRIVVLVEMLSTVPLRLKHFAVLTGSHLRRVGSHYRLHIPGAEFKNRGYTSDNDLLVLLPDSLTALLDMYFAYAWRILNATPGALADWNLTEGRFEVLPKFQPESRVFERRCATEAKTEADRTKRICDSLRASCYRATARWLPAEFASRGLYPHAFRLIVARAMLKNGNTLEDVARVLWTRCR